MTGADAPSGRRHRELAGTGRRSRVEWFAGDPAGAVFAFATSGLLAFGLVGLPLAIVGVFRPWLVVPPVAAAWWLIARRGRGLLLGPSHGAPRWPAVLALGVALAFGAFAAAHSSEHLLTNRDPGVYFVTGKWLATHGTLLYDSGLPSSAVITLHPHAWSSQGVYPQPNGTATFQFQHLLGVLLAAAHWAGGDWLMFRLPALLAAVSLLGVFLLARRLTSGPLALIAVVGIAIHPVSLHFAKDAYSEWLALTFAFAGLLAWLHTARDSPLHRFGAVGLILGAGTLARIDAWLTVTAFFLGIAYLVATGSPARRPTPRQVAAIAAGVWAVGLLGLADLRLRAPYYLVDLTDQLAPLIASTVAAILLALVARWPADALLTGRRGLVRRLLSWAAPAAVVAAGLYALFIRPAHPVTAGAPAWVVEALQAREGLAIEPLRTYAEASLQWFAAYQGHALVLLMIAAVAHAAWATARGDTDRRFPIVSVLLGVSVVYLWRPSITPDHFWAMRRFLPIVLPLGFVALSWALSIVGRLPRLRRTAMAAAAIPLLLGAVSLGATGAPVATIRTEVGVLAATRDLCAALPDRAAVLLDDALGIVYSAAIRSYCGVPTLRGIGARATDLVRTEGHVPVAITTGPSCIRGPEIGTVSIAYEYPELTLVPPPRRADTGALSAHLRVIDASQPGAALPDGALGFEVSVATTWRPDSGSAVIARMGHLPVALWLEYRPTGTVDLFLMGPDGPVGLTVSPYAIDDGVARTMGAYLLDGRLVTTCGGQVVSDEVVPVMPTFTDTTILMTPVADDGEFGATLFQGDVVLLGHAVP
jgi:hypothetical protein